MDAPHLDPFDSWLAHQQDKDLVRVLAAGSVDDGKSTLIGRLLHDAQVVYDDQLEAVRRDSARWGTTGDDPDLALLLDGLRAEREQGITIDVAYRSFSTARRRFIVADAPGHEQYTRNMVTGASTADVAVLLVDARAGLLRQTRRHAVIASLLGIRHVCVVVNKLDLCAYERDAFERVRDAIADFAGRLDIPDLRFIPVSALRGDNIVERGDRMPWYHGETLLEYLDQVHVASDGHLADFRFPVQGVVRGDSGFRGLAGPVASGIVRRGDEVAIWPSGERTRIATIVTRDGPLEEAHAPMPVVLVLEGSQDVGRGDLIAHVDDGPRVQRLLEAMLVWFDDEPLRLDRRYLVRHATRTVPGIVQALIHGIDVNTMERQDARTLARNDVGRVRIAMTRPIACDPYRRNRHTGGFLLVDPITNRTAAAGMIVDVDQLPMAGRSGPGPIDLVGPAPRSRITLEERVARSSQPPLTVLLTGTASSGKTTIGQALERRLFDAGYSVMLVDGRVLRETVSRDLGFSWGERAENVLRAAGVAKVLNAAGVICICALESPSREARARARDLIGAASFVEVYVWAPLAVRKARDREGLYAAAEAGDIDLPGVNGAYEPPEAADLELPTHELDVETCVDRLLDLLHRRL